MIFAWGVVAVLIAVITAANRLLRPDAESSRTPEPFARPSLGNFAMTIDEKAKARKMLDETLKDIWPCLRDTRI